jgi:serine/threonine protein kinase
MPDSLMQTSAKPNVETCPSCGTSIDVSAEDPFALVHCSSCGAGMRVRKEFASFEIQGILGEGGQGVVLRAMDKKLHRPVAIKLMKREYSTDPTFVKRFESEAQITAGLNHPNIVKVFSFGKQRDLLYIAMEIVDFGSLDALMAQVKKVPEEEALNVGVQIAQGLKAGLDRGLIHRDIKPGNILFADEHTAKIVDFGLAILVHKQHEESGDVWATPFYVAPEKLDGRPEDFRSDMYSLAATLFHAIAGRPPFTSESNSMTALRQIKSRPVQLRSYAPHVSTATAFAIDKALSVDPKDRFASYDEFIQNLEYARSELKKRHRFAPVPRVVKVGDPSHSGSWITFATVMLVVSAGVFAWVSRGHPSKPSDPLKTTTAAHSTSSLADEAAFDEGRRQLLERNFRAAAATFHKLYEEGRLLEPKNSWAAVHEALAESLAGRSGRARKALRTLSERIAPTAIGLDPQLVSFINRLAALGPEGQPVKAGDSEHYNTSTYEALAYLMMGAGKWESGQVDEGAALLRRFADSKPTDDSVWVADYRPLTAPYLDEYEKYLAIKEALAKATVTPVEGEAALKQLAEVRSALKSPALIRNLDRLETEVVGAIAAAKAAAAAARAEMEAKQNEAQTREEALLTSAKYQLKDLCENYRFAEALALIRSVDVKLDRSIAERDLLARRLEWLVNFKKRLVDDLNVGSYTMPIVRKNGQQLVGGIKRATEQQLEIRLQFGSLPISWADLSPQTVLQLARAYMRPTLPPATLAERKWEAGVFCLFAQLFSEGQTLMDDASAQKEEYRTHRTLFFGQPAADPAPEPSQKPSIQEKPADDVQPSSGLEMAEQPLNVNKMTPNEAIIRGIRRPPTP